MTKTILVADNSRTIRRAVELTFRSTDFQVVTVPSADEALAKLSNVRPDLVLADASMPGTDGYDLCSRIKSNATTARIPVLVFASKFGPFDETRGRNAQADGHVDKPWDTQALINLVKEKIGLPVDGAAPQSFAATLAKRQEPPAAPSNGRPPAAPPAAHAPPPSPFGAPARDRAPPPVAPPPVAPAPRPAVPVAPVAPVAPIAPVMPAPMAAKPPVDDVLIEEPDDADDGPSLEPPPMPRRNAPKVDVWALQDDRGTPDAGPPPGADDPIEEIAIEDVPPEPMREVVGRIADAAAPAVAQMTAAAAAGVPSAQLVAMTREIIERVAWEVVPELAETIIRAELARLLEE
jgi:CheY-like chemotaxis protein